ncbi:MAG: FAD-dependent oxidoreductase [Planctomycetaceae bacterium]|nr:FAD-dependent oxidoreductase [Planctomycetaceae bacterium]
MYDVAVVGAGIAGMSTAARLQALGLSTIIFESHSQPGGCAGFFCRRGFSFDVGATTLVDFDPGGVGGELLESIGMPPLLGQSLKGYCAWLPDRKVLLHRDHGLWSEERLNAFGNSPKHRKFWHLIDRLAEVFWRASRCGIKLPVTSAGDLLNIVRSIGIGDLSLVRYLNWTMQDALNAHGLSLDRPLIGLLSMLIEDTVHSTVSQAPLINAALGITIRGAGLSRATGGMRGFWNRFSQHYESLGGELLTRCRVNQITGTRGSFSLLTTKGEFGARQVVSALPVQLTREIAPKAIGPRIANKIDSPNFKTGGAIVVFLGVPEQEVSDIDNDFTHHQLLQSYSEPLGNGNNMFISVSDSEDTGSAPNGYRSVMISTHCELESWQGLSPDEYAKQKNEIGEKLITCANRAYPLLGTNPVVREVATPLSYERFTRRPLGAVGGFRQNLRNSNQFSIPHESTLSGFWLAGDTTWPGLGTVAAVLGSRIVAECAFKLHRKLYRHQVPRLRIGFVEKNA